ncbi:hypothetical protein ACPV11_003501 [Escherichia coli]
MTTITDKKQYPGEQYLNELITNIEFAARAPVEVVRAMAAELQKRREADSAEPASNHEELPLDYLQGQKDGLEWAAQLAEANHPQTGDWLYDDPLDLAKAIRKGPDIPEFAGPHPVTPDSSVPAPGKGVTGERIRIKPHVYRELVNRLHDTAIKCAGTQQLRERISRVLGDVITPDHHKQAEKSGLERCHLEAALNIKPGHTLGIIDALLVHKMARALLPLVDAGDTSEGEV